MLIASILVAAATPVQPSALSPNPAFVTEVQRGLTRQEVANVAQFIRVWGFAKYHHPAGVTGSRDFDAEFTRVLPAVASARNDAEAAAALVRWLDGLGTVKRCTSCAASGADALVSPTPDWLANGKLESQLKSRLQWIYDNRSTAASQHYVGLGGAGNPVFPNESAGMSGSDPAVRLLSLARYWNVIRYWSPYRKLTDRDWDSLLGEYVLRFANADRQESYEGVLTRLSVELGDGHSAVKQTGKVKWSGLNGSAGASTDSPICIMPVDWRFAGERLTIYKGPPGVLEPGDVVLAIDDVPIAQWVRRIEAAVPSSTHAWLLKRSEDYLLAGNCNPGLAMLTIARDGTVRHTRVVREPPAKAEPLIGKKPHDRPGPAFQLLPDNIAYLKLSAIKAADVPGYMEQARTTRGLIVDIRNYPAEFVPFALAQYFSKSPVRFAKFTVARRNTPGAFAWTPPMMIEPVKTAAPLSIPLVVLVDDASISQSEYTAMALQAVGGRVVGSTTAGADGNISFLPLPTGEEMIFTGIGVYYPDGTATQRIGIVPHNFVQPTPAGVAAGRDEILDAAVRSILGRG